MAHELVHSLNKSGDQGLVLKLDFEKAYARNFHPLLITWIKQIVIGGSISIMLNGEDSSSFKTGKGLRQGDPLSPCLFNLVGDGLAKMLVKSN